jgi:hypothetical protein
MWSIEHFKVQILSSQAALFESPSVIGGVRMASALSLVTPQGDASELQLKVALFCVTSGRVPIDEVCTLMPLFLELFFQVRSWIEIVARGL